MGNLNYTNLHQHLGFSSTPHFLWELAHEQGIKINQMIRNKADEHDLDKIILAACFGMKKENLRLTFHTGKISSIFEMEEIISKTKPERIVHGIKAFFSKKIVLEIFLDSNLALKIIRSWQELRKVLNIFQKNGVLFTINL